MLSNNAFLDQRDVLEKKNLGMAWNYVLAVSGLAHFYFPKHIDHINDDYNA